MTLTEKSAYIKGLMDGLDLDADKKEVKVIKALVDLVEDLTLTVTDLDEDVDQVYDELDAIDEDITDLEDVVYGDEDDECCDCHDEDEMYEITCPACGETVCVDEDLLLSEDLACPACGEKFEVDFDDVDDTVHFNGKPVEDGDDTDEE
jgi:DNA-directed RNA polymerase subunit RPC12/RpoP